MQSFQASLALLQQSIILPSVDCFLQTLQQCKKEKENMVYAKDLHVLIHRSGLETHNVLANNLVPVLVECGYLSLAQQVFYKVTCRSERSWTSLIQGFVESDQSQLALTLFQQMKEECLDATSYTFVALLKSCMYLQSLEKAQEFHKQIVEEGIEKDAYVGSALVNVYCQAGLLEEACDVFDELSVRDVVLWTCLISEYNRRGFPHEALNRLAEMEDNGPSMDATAYICGLKACSIIGDIDKGSKLHYAIVEDGLEKDSFVGNTLIDMYAKCGFFAEALDILDEFPVRDVVAWNALISSYSERGLGVEVITCLERMVMEGLCPDSVTFICALQAFGNMRNNEKAQQLHMEISKKGWDMNILIGNALVDSYSKCGLVVEAYKIFMILPIHDTVSWSALLTGFADCGFCKEVSNCLEQIELEDLPFDTVMFVSVLKACSSIGALDKGWGYHASIVKLGFEKHQVIGNSLIDMYAKCGALAEAQTVFINMEAHCVVSWNSLLAGYAEQGLAQQALDGLAMLQTEGLLPDTVTYIIGLKSCGITASLVRGQELHIEITKRGLERDLLVGTGLVDLYAKSGVLTEAQEVFDGLQEQNIVSWAALLGGYVEGGYCEEALILHEEMQQAGVFSNAIVYVCVLKACGKLGSVGKGIETHIDIVLSDCETDRLVSISLINMYAKCGFVEESQDLLDCLPIRDVVSWNALITGYAECGRDDKILESVMIMEWEGIGLDEITYACYLKACGNFGSEVLGQLVHAMVIEDGLESDNSITIALLGMYANHGLFQEVEEVFSKSQMQNTATWNAVLTGYDEHGLSEDVFRCFKEMKALGAFPNGTTYACVLRACCRAGLFERGMLTYAELASEGYERDPSVVFTLVDMYIKNGLLGEAQQITHEQPTRDIGVWNTLMSAHIKHGFNEEALAMLENRLPEDFFFHDVTASILSLKACAVVGAISKGQEVHKLIVEQELGNEKSVANTVMDMYAKCGFLAEAQDVFDELGEQDVVSYSVLISGYACRGDHVGVFKLLGKMIEEGVEPDEVILLRALSVCSHAGFVEEGHHYLASISKACLMSLTIEHCNCVIDLFSRAGRLDEAAAIFAKMPCQPDLVTWTIILGACQKWSNLDLGRSAFEAASSLDMDRAVSFVLMSNIVCQ